MQIAGVWVREGKGPVKGARLRVRTKSCSHKGRLSRLEMRRDELSPTSVIRQGGCRALGASVPGPTSSSTFRECGLPECKWPGALCHLPEHLRKIVTCHLFSVASVSSSAPCQAPIRSVRLCVCVSLVLTSFVSNTRQSRLEPSLSIVNCIQLPIHRHLPNAVDESDDNETQCRYPGGRDHVNSQVKDFRKQITKESLLHFYPLANSRTWEAVNARQRYPTSLNLNLIPLIWLRAHRGSRLPLMVWQPRFRTSR